LARRADRAADGTLNEKADKRFDADALTILSRIYAREAAMKVGQDGLKWILGADTLSSSEIAEFENTLNLSAIYQTQSGQVDDMDSMCKVLYSKID
jgi:hypothetical protein